MLLKNSLYAVWIPSPSLQAKGQVVEEALGLGHLKL